MVNSTDTFGYMVGAVTSDAGLRDFFQVMIKSILGLSGNLVRPMWQPNPPKQPAIDVNWCAFGWTNIKADANAYVKMDANGLGGRLIRYEDLELSVIFYGENSHGYATLLRDGLEIGQNRDTLRVNGIAYIADGGLTRSPELINGLWYDRHDLKLTFNREVNRVYNILSFVDAEGVIKTDHAIPITRQFSTVIR